VLIIQLGDIDIAAMESVEDKKEQKIEEGIL